jgi:dephospho-CoA kinase
MRVLGLVGGIGSGKSASAAVFVTAGAKLLDADQMARAVLDQPEVQHALVTRWGADLVGTDARIDRQRLAAIVFGDDASSRAALDYLEELTHPLVWRQTLAALRAAARDRMPAVVIDAPLLLEAGWDLLCDAVVFVDSPWNVRVQRVANRGWTAAELARRERRQWPIEFKRWRAHAVINNRSDDPQSLQRQVAEVWSQWIGDAGVLLDVRG